MLSAEEINRRVILGTRILDLLPPEALSRLQILQPAIGCLNRCNFCSQVAGPVTSELGSESLRAVIGSLRGAMLALGLERVGGDREHKDGVIFPYLDNDIGSYPYLSDYLVGIRSLGARTRISTVGWSRHNRSLQDMHEKIAIEQTGDIDGIRFSLTPYTHGWRVNRNEYLDDFGSALATYRPLIKEKGVGRRTACIEMRFAPDVQIGDVEYQTIGKYNIVRCREYSLVTRAEALEANGRSIIVGLTADGPELNQNGAEALQIVGELTNIDEGALSELFTSASEECLRLHKKYGVLVHRGQAHIFQNADGPYFCFNPLKSVREGTFTAIHYYPQTETRQTAGLLDATRPFLNNLLALKQQNGIEPREDFSSATEKHIKLLIHSLRREVELMRQFSTSRGAYIEENVIPIVEGLIYSMTVAGLTAADLFCYGLVVDTGVIVNQGKAITEFRGLASRPDMPMTPNEEKGYGDISQSSVRGNTWRISPIVALDHMLRVSGYGKKSLPIVSANDNGLSLGVFEWNPQTFNNNDVEGNKLRSLHVPVGDLLDSLVKITPEQGKKEYRLPGSIDQNARNPASQTKPRSADL